MYLLNNMLNEISKRKCIIDYNLYIKRKLFFNYLKTIRIAEIILVPEHIKQIVDEMNEQIEANQKPCEMELNGLDGKIEETARVSQIHS